MAACCSIAVFNASEGCIEDEGAVIASSTSASENILGTGGKIEGTHPEFPWHIADISRGVFRVHHGGNTPISVSQQLSLSQFKQVNTLSLKTGFPSSKQPKVLNFIFNSVLYACRGNESDES